MEPRNIVFNPSMSLQMLTSAIPFHITQRNGNSREFGNWIRVQILIKINKLKK